METKTLSIVEKKVRGDLLISEEDQAVLIQIRDNIRYNYFAIGDVANKYVVLCSQRKKAVLSQAVYDAVGEFVGKSGRTVRYYAEQAAFYHPDTRDRYDILPFSFFVFARSMGDRNWETILDYCMTKPNKSLAFIRRKFLYEPDREADRDGEAEDKIPTDEIHTSSPDGKNISVFLSVMLDLSSRALALSDHLSIPPDAKLKLREAATQIREVLNSIS